MHIQRIIFPLLILLNARRRLCVDVPHLSKHQSDFKQNAAQEKKIFSAPLFHDLLSGGDPFWYKWLQNHLKQTSARVSLLRVEIENETSQGNF